MDDSVTPQDHAKHRAEVRHEVKRITPPSESNTSTILNGVGNGMMVGTAPFIATGIYDQIADKNLSKKFSKISAFALVIGSAVGAVLGIREARRLEAYRENLGEEIVSLRTQANDTEDRLKKWETRMAKHEHAAHQGEKIR